MTKRLLGLAALAAALLCGSLLLAAGKSYQFTGTVKTVEGSGFTVEKTAQEVWEFSTDASTKGTPKVGDHVTVHYKMIATEIETKAVTTARKH